MITITTITIIITITRHPLLDHQWQRPVSVMTGPSLLKTARNLGKRNSEVRFRCLGGKAHNDNYKPVVLRLGTVTATSVDIITGDDEDNYYSYGADRWDVGIWTVLGWPGIGTGGGRL